MTLSGVTILPPCNQTAQLGRLFDISSVASLKLSGMKGLKFSDNCLPIRQLNSPSADRIARRAQKQFFLRFDARTECLVLGGCVSRCCSDQLEDSKFQESADTVQPLLLLVFLQTPYAVSPANAHAHRRAPVERGQATFCTHTCQWSTPLQCVPRLGANFGFEVRTCAVRHQRPRGLTMRLSVEQCTSRTRPIAD